MMAGDKAANPMAAMMGMGKAEPKEMPEKEKPLTWKDHGTSSATISSPN